MNVRRWNRWARGLVYGAATLCLACASMWHSVRSSAAPAGGAAAGAAVGVPLGPIGMIVGAATGAIIAHAVEENAALRSGEIQGEEARAKEDSRWKGLTPAEWERRASLASQAEERLTTLIKWGLAVGAVWFGWRNRHNIKARGSIKGLWHGAVGGVRTVK